MLFDRTSSTLIATLTLALAGCSSEKDSAAAAGGPADSGTGSAFEEMMAYDWTIQPGEETYYCVFKTLDEDLWVNEYRPLSPAGTHHVSIGYIDKPRADGVVQYGEDIYPGTPCNGLTLGDRLAFGGVFGTGGMKFPEGVAVKFSKGQQVLLSVHVSNTTQNPLSGRTGVEIVPVKPDGVENEAEMLFVNNAFLNVTPGKSTQTGTCTLDAESNLMALVHHMHETGTHMRTRALPANGEPSVILDADYTFTEQNLVPLDPIVKLAAGDKIEVSCDYENPTANTLQFGESTYDSEMCISIMLRYPATATNFNCIAGP